MKNIYVIKVKTPQNKNKYAHLYEDEVVDILRKASDPYDVRLTSDSEYVIVIVSILTSQVNVNSVVGEIKYNLGFEVDLEEVTI